MTERKQRLGDYAVYVIFITTAIYFVNIGTRSVLSILLPQIREEFGLSDTEIGLLAGTAFGLVFTVMTIPLAMLSDRFNRRNILVIAIAVFSMMSILSGFVLQFWQLVLTRVGFGAVQGAFVPAINSMLADVVPKYRRASVLSLATVGGRAGSILGVLVCGWIAAEYGWRTAIIAAGIPGLALALLMFASLKEPARGAIENRKDEKKALSFWSSLKLLFATPTYRCILLSGSVLLFVTLPLTLYLPILLTRVHGLPLKEVTLVVTGYAIVMAIGAYAVGWIADKLAAGRPSRMLSFPGLLQLVVLPFFVLFLVTDSVWIAVAAGAVPYTIGTGAFIGPVFNVLQGVAPLRARGMAMGLYVFTSSLFGFTIGPQVIGIVSDWIRPEYGIMSLPYAMLLFVVPAHLLGTWFFWRASQTMHADMKTAEAAG